MLLWMIPAVKTRVGRPHGCTIDRYAHHFVRARVDSGEALFGDRSEPRNLVQPAAPDLRLAPAAAVPVREGGRAGHARRDGEGLRVRQGPVRDVHAGRAEAARG